MYKNFIGRVCGGSDAKRLYYLPIPPISCVVPDYLPNAKSGIYVGKIKRLVPESRARVERLNDAVQHMTDLGIRLMSLSRTGALDIWLHENLRYTDHAAQWRFIESALQSAFGLPICDVARRKVRHSIKLPKQRHRKKAAR